MSLFFQAEKNSLTTYQFYKRESVGTESSKWEGLLDSGPFDGVEREWGLVSSSGLQASPNHKANLLVP